MTAFAAAMASLHNSLRGIAGLAGKYRRDVLDCDCVFVPCESVSTDYGEDGSVITARTHDWKLQAGELVIAGNEIFPQLGDLVVLDDGRTFVVVSGDGEKCWRWTDYTRTAIRFHTVEQVAV